MSREFLVSVSLKMKINLNSLDTKLSQNVCEVVFIRKRPVAGSPATRRMWCTKSHELLNSVNGRTSLNYRPPKGSKRFVESTNNVLIVWDIFMQDYRAINMGSCNLVQEIPANDEFWEYYNKNLLPMSAEEKQAFMSS